MRTSYSPKSAAVISDLAILAIAAFEIITQRDCNISEYIIRVLCKRPGLFNLVPMLAKATTLVAWARSEDGPAMASKVSRPPR